MEKATQLTRFEEDPHLVHFETILRRSQPFNIVSVLGLHRQELRHSDILAYLLTPHQSHALETQFLQALLQRVAPLSSENIDIEALQLTSVTVQREWRFIDILIESPNDRLAIIIENKVDSTEHSNQLDRYYQLVRQRRPDWRIIGIYLTLEGTSPAQAIDRAHYVPLGYSDIVVMLRVCAAHPDIASDVQLFLQHYAAQIRSDLVPDPNSDKARMARELYMEHRAAIEAIAQARETRQKMIQNYVNRLLTTTVREQPDTLRLDDSTNLATHRWHIRFAPPEWYRPDFQIARWTSSKQILLFQFIQEPDRVWIDLAVSHAPKAQPLREALYELALNEQHPFMRWHGDSSDDWFSIYGRWILSRETNYFATYTDEAIRQALRAHWEHFIHHELPLIRATIERNILSRTWNEQ